jgi:hypothetical protein
VRGQDTHIGPPLFGAHAASFAVVGVDAQLVGKGFGKGGFDLGSGEAGETALVGDCGVLLCDTGFGGEERAEGVEAEEKVTAGHFGCMQALGAKTASSFTSLMMSGRLEHWDPFSVA